MTLTLVADPNAAYRDPTIIDRLDDHMIEEFAPAFMPKWNKYIPHMPTVKQWAFLLLDCLEGLYGGAGGGGKTDALLMAGLQYVDIPGYSALLLRRTYADLEKPDCLIPRSHEWLDDTDAHWDGANRRWRFPSGALLDFGYLDRDDDKRKYKSAAYHFVGFDELTEFMEGWYTYLFSRTRRLSGHDGSSQIPIRVRGATNPDGPGHDWVQQRFLIEGTRYGRAFIPAKLEDNPHIDQEEYDKSLRAASDPIMYAQIRLGDWGVRTSGGFLKKQWFQVIEQAPAGIHWIRSWDFAATKNLTSAWTAGAELGLLDGVLYIMSIVRMRGDPGEVEDIVKQTAMLDGKSVAVWIEQEPGSGGVNTMFRYQRNVLLGYAVRPFLPKTDKLSRARVFSAMARAGNVKLILGDWIGAFLSEADAFPNGFKDQVDACSAGVSVLTMDPTPRVRRL
jgi:predicted phage terminase large subunit-like protein